MFGFVLPSSEGNTREAALSFEVNSETQLTTLTQVFGPVSFDLSNATHNSDSDVWASQLWPQQHNSKLWLRREGHMSWLHHRLHPTRDQIQSSCLKIQAWLTTQTQNSTQSSNSDFRATCECTTGWNLIPVLYLNLKAWLTTQTQNSTQSSNSDLSHGMIPRAFTWTSLRPESPVQSRMRKKIWASEEDSSV